MPVFFKNTAARLGGALSLNLSVGLLSGLLAGSLLGLAPSRADAQDVAARLQACAACHGENGVSVLAGIPSLAGQPRVFLENQLVMIREGLREIPQMAGMLDGVSDADLAAMARQLSSQPARLPEGGASPRQPELFARGQTLAESMRCGICHLPDYKGREQMPRLAAQREDYLVHSMLQFKNNQATGRDTIMAASLYGVSDEDIKAMAHFLAHTAP